MDRTDEQAKLFNAWLETLKSKTVVGFLVGAPIVVGLALYGCGALICDTIFKRKES